jgi:hypothetical protein
MNAIKQTLGDMTKLLDSLKQSMGEEERALKVLQQQIVNAKTKAMLMGHKDVAIALPQEKLLEGFASSCAQRQAMAGCIAALCDIVGSIVVQVEPGKVETLDGKAVPYVPVPASEAPTIDPPPDTERAPSSDQ